MSEIEISHEYTKRIPEDEIAHALLQNMEKEIIKNMEIRESRNYKRMTTCYRGRVFVMEGKR